MEKKLQKRKLGLRHISNLCSFGVRSNPRDETPFFWIAKAFVTEYMRELSNVAVAVYVILAWAEHYKSKRIILSYKLISRFTGYSRDYVIKGIKELQKWGLILVARKGVNRNAL